MLFDSTKIPTLQEPVTDATRDCAAVRDAAEVLVDGKGADLTVSTSAIGP